MIRLSNVTLQLGAKLLFTDTNLTLLPGLKYGLVGANGTGKSSLLRLLGGEEDPSEGAVSIAKGARVGWLQQDHYLYEEEPILDVVVRGKPELWNAMQEKGKLLKHAEWTEQMGYQLAALEETIAHYSGYSAESFASTLLVGLGIEEEVQYESLKVLSGGYKLRALLARTLFSEPDILLLDEPTNYLDIVTISWLERYLRDQFSGVLLLTSHDHDFLNNLATHILDIDYGEVRQYTGNYDHFAKEKQQVMEQKLSEQRQIEERIAKMRVFIERFRSKPSKARQCMAREKMIDKIEMPDIRRSSRRAPQLHFRKRRSSGKRALRIQDVSKSFGDKQVLKDVHFIVNRGEKVAIIGPNGIGKSTLLKGILGHLELDQGEVEWGHEVQTSYFPQDHHEVLSDDCTVLEWLAQAMPQASHAQLRQALGQTLFSQDEVNKRILNLSGGEMARLILAKMTLEQGNTLIFDEPTNHLDIESREALANSLQDYEGTILLVSHDRHFVSLVAKRVIAITHEGLHDYRGTYDEYLAEEGEDYLNRK